MKYKKIALVNPPLDDGVVKCIDDGFWQPLNLLTLSSYLSYTGYKGEIKIFDQAVLSEEKLIESLIDYQPDLTGISPNMDSYEKCLVLSKKIKENGSEVLLGGAYATTLSFNIMANRKYIDYIITHDGERPIAALVEGKPLDKVPNLVYRKDGKIISNDVLYNKTATLCDIDSSLIDMQSYFKNYQQSIHPGKYKRPLTTISQRGCVWRERTRGCLFCSRLNPLATFDDYQKLWRDIHRERETYGIDCIIDVGDDFLGNRTWFENFYKSRPNHLKDIGIRFIYSRVEHMNEKTADMLKDLNVSEICLGLESGDRHILRKVRKGNTPEQHIKAVKLLAERDINLISAFMIGHPSENDESVKNTIEHIQEILAYNNTNELVVSIFTPLPGSQAYEMLVQESIDVRKNFCQKDSFDIRLFQQEWIKHFCELDYDTVMNYANTISDLHQGTYIEFTA